MLYLKPIIENMSPFLMQRLSIRAVGFAACIFSALISSKGQSLEFEEFKNTFFHCDTFEDEPTIFSACLKDPELHWVENSQFVSDFRQLDAYFTAWDNPENYAMGGGQIIGNGGDPLYQIMIEARSGAFQALYELDLTKIDVSSLDAADTKTLNFLIKNREDFLKNISSADFIWIVKKNLPSDTKLQNTCAHTNMSADGVSPSTIFFVLENCLASIGSEHPYKYMLLTLLHEVTHQFSNKESCRLDCLSESFADAVAQFIQQQWTIQKISSGQLWLETPSIGLEARHHVGAALRESPDNKKLAFLWGGCSSTSDIPEFCSKNYHDGMLLEFDTKSHDIKKSVVSERGAPSARAKPFIFWADQNAPAPFAEKFVVFGGCLFQDWSCKESYHDLYTYDLINNSWKQIPINIPEYLEQRINAKYLWTGAQLVVFGGTNLDESLFYNDGAILSWNFKTNEFEWKPLVPTADLNMSPRKDHSLTFTGAELIVWGGCGPLIIGCKALNDGFAFNPTTNIWRRLTTQSAPSPRSFHSAVWNGQHLIIWGGMSHNSLLNNGSLYDPLKDSWEALSSVMPGLEAGRMQHSALWSQEIQTMLVFGGLGTNESYPNTLLALQRNKNGDYRWLNYTAALGIQGRIHASVINLGSGLFTWGGQREGQDLEDGGLLLPYQLLKDIQSGSNKN
ncbi:MAG: hypothetical protein KBD78_06830 [Oligoflexales bacterium]|nr:hypothetical protein [Oligoflexales bacterium]